MLRVLMVDITERRGPGLQLLVEQRLVARAARPSKPASARTVLQQRDQAEVLGKRR